MPPAYPDDPIAPKSPIPIAAGSIDTSRWLDALRNRSCDSLLFVPQPGDTSAYTGYAESLRTPAVAPVAVPLNRDDVDALEQTVVERFGARLRFAGGWTALSSARDGGPSGVLSSLALTTSRGRVLSVVRAEAAAMERLPLGQPLILASLDVDGMRRVLFEYASRLVDRQLLPGRRLVFALESQSNAPVRNLFHIEAPEVASRFALAEQLLRAVRPELLLIDVEDAAAIRLATTLHAPPNTRIVLIHRSEFPGGWDDALGTGVDVCVVPPNPALAQPVLHSVLPGGA